MKKKLISNILFFLSLFILIISFSQNRASAHLIGQAPYLKINGVYTILYNVLLNAPPVQGLNIPEDNAPDTYVINQPITFELDKNFLPLNRVDIQKASYYWDFGDGTKAEGITVTHTYSKIGSYILILEAKNAPSFIRPFKNFPFESVLINILPDKNYQLPQARIEVNNKSVSDPITEFVPVDFSKVIHFNGLSSIPGSGNIISFFWDLGDNKSTTIASPDHFFERTLPQAYPILRVKDKNGFISDTSLELDNTLFMGGKNPFNTVMINKPDVTEKQNTLLLISTKLNNFIKLIIIDFFRQKHINYFFLVTILIFAFFAGSLHALTPGHGKSLMAAFLVGRGKSKIVDVFIIASSITFTHTIVVYALGILFLFISIKYPLQVIVPYFDKMGAILIIGIAFTLIFKGYKNITHKRHHDLKQKHSHNHVHLNDKIKKHSNAIELFVLGVSGGITPCVDALALLILAVSINQILFGLVVVFTFSLGLAACIIALGFLIVLGKNKLPIGDKFKNFAQIYAPFIAAIFIFLLGINLLFT